ncbi:hypothetical protein ACSNOH_33935 [Streptomyces sp. URMC 127]|uniref:hypothetical protein n=1 Tax=Streptomyces sp. URMC 127 TaxID=3423402 RepID=UPI003F1C3601
MDHRIGQNTPPTHAAGTDPAFIPGLTPPRPAAAEERPAVPADSVPDAVAASEPPAETEAAAVTTGEAAPAANEEEPRPAADGPAFEASDRRGSVTVDSTGVTLRLDGETADFDWPEVGAVETHTPRFGRQLTITVHATNHHSYNVHIEAPNRNQLKQWATELDAVLDSYFEDTKSTD